MISRIIDFFDGLWFALETAWFFMRADARREYRLWEDEGKAEAADLAKQDRRDGATAAHLAHNQEIGGFDSRPCYAIRGAGKRTSLSTKSC